jgi:hypothetical protein
VKFLRGYQPDVVTDLPLPAGHLQPGVWFGGLSPQAVREVNVWLALADEAELNYRIATFGEEDTWSAIVSPSRLARLESLPPAVAAMLGLTRPDESFGAIVRTDHRMEMLIRGLPTEDAWEAFSDHAQSA